MIPQSKGTSPTDNMEQSPTPPPTTARVKHLGGFHLILRNYAPRSPTAMRKGVSNTGRSKKEVTVLFIWRRSNLFCRRVNLLKSSQFFWLHAPDFPLMQSIA